MTEQLSLVALLGGLGAAALIGFLSGVEKLERQSRRRKRKFPSASRVVVESDEKQSSRALQVSRMEILPAIRPGDSVTYAFTDDPDRHITVTISDTGSAPSRGLLHAEHPLVKAMNDADVSEGEAVELPAGGTWRQAQILRIVHILH